MFGVEYNVGGLKYINFVLADEEMKEFDPEFYNWACKNPMEWDSLIACSGNLSAMGFWADESTPEGKALLKKHLLNELSDDSWEEYFYLNCPWGKESGNGTCPLKECSPRECERSNWGEPWEDRSFTATANDEYYADGKSFNGGYTEQIMKDWGIPYVRGEK